MRPLDALQNSQPPELQTDAGILYGSNIIDPYTERNPHGGLDVFWLVSTWNPYTVLLMKSHFHAP